MPKETVNYEALLEQVKSGLKLDEALAASIRAQLASGESDGDPYTLIHILGKANDRDSRTIIERYIDFGLDDPEDDGLVRKIAIQVLSVFWNDRHYFNVVAEKARNDPSPFAQMAAVSGVASLGRAWPDLRAQATGALLEGFETSLAQGPDRDQDIWEAFHRGLLEVFGVPTREWPQPGELSEATVRWDVIQKAREGALH